MKIIWFALVIHFIFLASVFDIYFTTPIVCGVPSLHNVFPPPAKRLVLFVADGMRADTFYRLSTNETNAPVLRKIIEETGTWGVSHTRVPTESRPGHVALIAGLYEDPSAITKGWKENPVQFDSVFNRSTFTWAWGSPDILPMFSKACGGRMWTQTYEPEDQDFSGGMKSTSWLDEWVFARFEAFMAQVGSDLRHRDLIHKDGIIFFLHLLATDTAGHTFKPHSWEYQKNVKLIDNGVKKVMSLVEDFYGHDGRTAYIFTADHGMTDWGSHGAGDASETQTPLVAWGAGVPASIPSGSPSCGDPGVEWPEVDDGAWNLSALCRQDVWQADIAPLMATLIGVPIPVNSVGYLRRSYLNLGAKEMAEAAFTNAHQVLSQHTRRRTLLEKKPWSCEDGGEGGWLCSVVGWVLPSLYRPYPLLPPPAEASHLASISRRIDAGEYKEAILESDELFELASSGLEYHHRYHKSLLLTTISLAFAAWILLLLVLVMDGGGHLKPLSAAGGGFEFKVCLDVPLILLSASMLFYLFALASPIQYYLYCLLPLVLWWMVARLISSKFTHKNGWNSYRMEFSWRNILSSFLFMAAYIMGIEILVLSFFHRWALSLGMAGLAVHPFTRLLSARRKVCRGDIAKSFYWALSCLILGVFSFMPVVGKEVNTSFVTTACFIFMAIGVLAAALVHTLDSRALSYMLLIDLTWPLLLPLVLFLPLTAWNVEEADQSFNENRGLPLKCQILSWILSVCSLAWPLVVPSTARRSTASALGCITVRLVSVSLALAVPYVLLSVNHEGFFLVALVINMHAWVTIEQVNAHFQGFGKVSWDYLRIAYIFVFLIITSFFGTGNMASVNSFDPAWVRRFLSVFSPHVMGALILAKTCIPFLLVSCAFRAVNVLLRTQTKRLFLVVLALSDVCGLHFLHCVTNKGSWLDIGSSLSHFVIQEVMVVFLVLLYGLSCYYVPSVEDGTKSGHSSMFLPLSSVSEEVREVQRGVWRTPPSLLKRKRT